MLSAKIRLASGKASSTNRGWDSRCLLAEMKLQLHVDAYFGSLRLGFQDLKFWKVECNQSHLRNSPCQASAAGQHRQSRDQQSHLQVGQKVGQNASRRPFNALQGSQATTTSHSTSTRLSSPEN